MMRTSRMIFALAARPALQSLRILAAPKGANNRVHLKLHSKLNYPISPIIRPFHGTSVNRMFIQVESTPNENALKFKPGIPVVDLKRDGNSCFEFTQFSETISSPLARAIFSIPGVKGVFFGSDFITVSKQEDMRWAILKPEIYAAVMDYFASPAATEKPLVFPSSTTDRNSAKQPKVEEDSEIVQMIRELLDTRIRPAVHEDGGDIEYVGFNTETGVVQLRLKGSCRGCSSSSITLKSGIENMLRHYIPEVQSVEQVLDEAEQEANEAFQKLEAKLNDKNDG